MDTKGNQRQRNYLRDHIIQDKDIKALKELVALRIEKGMDMTNITSVVLKERKEIFFFFVCGHREKEAPNKSQPTIASP